MDSARSTYVCANCIASTEFERGRRAEQLAKMSSSELATVSDSDRILLTLGLLRKAWMQQKPEDVAAKARHLLDLAARNRNDAQYGDAVFEANMLLGKIALRRGDKKAAGRNLLAAADTPGSERIRRGEFEMNLPRALVDWGERRTVAEFFERMAPKTSPFQAVSGLGCGNSKGRQSRPDPDVLLWRLYQRSL